MDDKTDFIVYCIEEYKSAENLSGKAVIELFNRYRVIDYIREYYEALHTTGRQYIVEDINLYIYPRILTTDYGTSDSFQKREACSNIKNGL